MSKWPRPIYTALSRVKRFVKLYRGPLAHARVSPLSYAVKALRFRWTKARALNTPSHLDRNTLARTCAPLARLQRPMFRYFLPLLLLGLAGCAASKTPSGVVTDARGVAASIVAGRAYDLSQSALRAADDAALQRAGKTYARATARIADKGELNVAVVPIVFAGMRLEEQAKEVALSYRSELQARALGKISRGERVFARQSRAGRN